MKFTCFVLSIFIIFTSCSPEVEDIPNLNDVNTITFIRHHDNPETEVVIKRMIRQSLIEEEYTILKHNDTIAFNSNGKAFFMIGVRATVLDSIILDRGDVVTIGFNDDSLQVVAEKSDIIANLNWFNNYHEKVEKLYEETLKPISNIPYNIEEFRQPLKFTNDFEILELRLTHVYNIDRVAYNRDNLGFDKKLKAIYTELDSLIRVSNIAMDSKLILSEILFLSTMDKFRRMGATVQDWMYNKMNADFKNDCNYRYTTNMSDFYLNHQTGKNFQKITYLDLEAAYQKNKEVLCADFRQEIQRVCLLKMCIKGNQLEVTKKLVDNYVNQYKDTVFAKFLENKFSLYESTLNGRAIKSVLVDIHNQEHSFDNLIKENVGNVLLVDFWASWCVPCRKGMPHIKKMEQKYGHENFKVIYASIDKYPNPWKRASKDDGIFDRNNYWVSNWSNSEIYKRFKITHIPRYIIYDKSGTVAYPNAPKSEAMEEIIVDLLSK